MGVNMDSEETLYDTKKPAQRAQRVYEDTCNRVPVSLVHTAKGGSISELHIERWHRARTPYWHSSRCRTGFCSLVHVSHSQQARLMAKAPERMAAADVSLNISSLARGYT